MEGSRSCLSQQEQIFYHLSYLEFLLCNANESISTFRVFFVIFKFSTNNTLLIA